MAIKDVVTRGYVSGGGEIALTVTRGYTIGAAVVFTAFQPGATRQLIQLQAPGHPRVDILQIPLPVEIEVPAPIDLTLVATAEVELPMRLMGGLTLRLEQRALAALRLVGDAGALLTIQRTAEHRLRKVPVSAAVRAELLGDVRVMVKAEMDVLREEEEALWLLGVR